MKKASSRKVEKEQPSPPASVVTAARDLASVAVGSEAAVITVAQMLARYDKAMSDASEKSAGHEELLALTLKHAQDIVMVLKK